MSQQNDTGWFDGACEPRNPGGAMSGGWVIQTADGRHLTGKGAVPADPANSNNVAEYRALIACLRLYLTTKRPGPLTIYGDSMLVVQQVSGAWGCKAAHLEALRQTARDLIKQVRAGVQLQHVPREQNTEADGLSVAALDALGIHRRERAKP